MLQIPNDYVLVEIEKTDEDTLRFSDGTIIYLDNSFNKERHRRTWGIVGAVPMKLTKNVFLRRDNDIKDYGRGNSYLRDYWKDITLADCPMEIQVGDKVVFDYVVSGPESIVDIGDGKLYYKIRYDLCHLVIRDGSIIPICGNVLLHKRLGDNIEEVDMQGKKVMVSMSKSGIIIGFAEPIRDEGIVAFIPTPFHCDTIEVFPGDIVKFPKNFDVCIDVEGKEYYIMKYWDIIGVINEE